MLARAAALLESGTVLTELVTGTGNARLSTGAIVTLALFGGVFVLAALGGTMVVPGLLVLAALWNTIRPPRLLGITRSETVIFGKSLWSGRPDRVLARYPVVNLVSGQPILDVGKVTLGFGSERITLSDRERARLDAAVTACTGRPLSQPLVASTSVPGPPGTSPTSTSSPTLLPSSPPPPPPPPALR